MEVYFVWRVTRYSKIFKRQNILLYNYGQIVLYFWLINTIKSVNRFLDYLWTIRQLKIPYLLIILCIESIWLLLFVICFYEHDESNSYDSNDQCCCHPFNSLPPLPLNLLLKMKCLWIYHIKSMLISLSTVSK